MMRCVAISAHKQADSHTLTSPPVQTHKDPVVRFELRAVSQPETAVYDATKAVDRHSSTLPTPPRVRFQFSQLVPFSLFSSLI